MEKAAENAHSPAQLRLEVDGAGLAGMAVSQVVALRGPGRLALLPPAALLGLAFERRASLPGPRRGVAQKRRERRKDPGIGRARHGPCPPVREGVFTSPVASSRTRAPRLLRQEAGRGQDPEGGPARAETAGQQRHLRLPAGRRPAGRGPRERPGRATGERLRLQRGRITPQAPALRTSHSRARPPPYDRGQHPAPGPARGRAGHSPIAATLPPATPKVQVERPQRSEDERPGGAARRRPHSAAGKARGQGSPVKPQRPKGTSQAAKRPAEPLDTKRLSFCMRTALRCWASSAAQIGTFCMPPTLRSARPQVALDRRSVAVI